MSDSPERKTHLLYVSLPQLLDAEGTAGLNEVLDDSLLSQGELHYATEITYRPVEVNAEGLVVIEATYVPDYSNLDLFPGYDTLTGPAEHDPDPHTTQ